MDIRPDSAGGQIAVVCDTNVAWADTGQMSISIRPGENQTGMARFLQANMHRSEEANDLLDQIVPEKKINLLIISEQYRNRDSPTWYSDNRGPAPIWVRNSIGIPVEDHSSRDGYGWIRIKGVTYVSCYLTPNKSIQDFQEKLDLLEDTLQEAGGRIMTAGDLNPRAVEWGMRKTDPRGKRILEMAARRGLLEMNTGKTSTFRRAGNVGTIPDITLASEEVAPLMVNWQVLEDYTGSDHQYVKFTMKKSLGVKIHKCKRNGWNVSKMNKDKFSLAVTRGQNSLMERSDMEAEATMEATMQIINQACEASMPRKKRYRNMDAAYWWNEEIAELRRECIICRRTATRKRATGVQTYKAAKKELNKAIKKSKRQSWGKLREEVDDDPWGLGYKIVTRKLGSLSASASMGAETMRHIVDVLFPTHPVREKDFYETPLTNIPFFTEEELIIAVTSLKNKKASGPDGIPAEVLKAVARVCPQILLYMMNACLAAGILHKQWQVQKLVLISKGKGDLNSPSLIDLNFPSSIHIEESRYTKKVDLLATLDVNNAFNSARWAETITALERFQTPEYLMRILRDPKRKKITSGAAQGSKIRDAGGYVPVETYIPLQIPTEVGSVVTTTKAAIKHRGIWMDNRLSFHKQLKQAADKAASVTSALSILMVNVSGPRPSKRRLLMTVAQSIMLYGAEIWADALKKKTHRKLLAVVQRRGALRIACFYRTVSEPEIVVIAGTIPIDLLAQEKKKVFLRKTEVT
ncbi:uncharacterized protein LOC117180687 [Belonocnema kinseyi]|uniref:uncharacterized protein LOC117180687 n=1 Tax=Belonocnema kinseyi TaxID=2817044 RepID=UPI00143CFF66|nr:uncharacterized protein LOC117180687 [Belonocnema kinseyi]